MIQRTVSTRLIFTALVIAVLLFLVGVLIGNRLADANSQSLENELDQLLVQASVLEFASLSSESDINQSLSLCPVYAEQLRLFDKQTEDFRVKLEFLASKFGKHDPHVQSLQRSYDYLQARDYLNVRRINKECGNHINVVLLFISEDCTACEQQLSMLADIKHESNFSVLIYTLDARQSHAAVQVLKAFYNVGTQLPVTVFNEHVLRGVSSRQQIESLL